MNERGDVREKAVAIVSLLVLGAGFLGMFLDVPWFWLIWVIGYAVVVPALSILFDVEETDAESIREDDHEDTETPEDPLETLRERYARGELTDEQFEQKLERLLETETIEDIEDARRRAVAERSDREMDAADRNATGERKR